MSQYVLHAVKAGATVIGGITSSELGPGIEVQTDPTDGLQYTTFPTIQAIEPGGSFVTKQIGAIATLGPTGAGISTLTGGLSLYFQKMVDEGMRAASGHMSQTLTKGLVYPQSLVANHGQDAQLTYTIAGGDDGSNDAIQVNTSVSLQTLPTEESFGLGTMQVGGVTVGEVSSLNIDFGLRVRGNETDGDITPTAHYIEQVQPVIRLTVRDLGLTASGSLGMFGTAGTHADTILWLRKRYEYSKFESDTATEHMKITASGLLVPEQASASGVSAAEQPLRIQCDYDGSNAPIIFTPNQAISA
jgi:hypothetical protein